MKLCGIWIAALMLLVAGCGGGEDEESTEAKATTTTRSLTKEELLAQGDAICAEVNAAVGTVALSDTDSTARITQEAELYSGMVERLKGLGRPDDATGYPEFVSAADELAQAESNAQLASQRGDESGLAEAEASASSALASFQEAAQAYGFEDCGEAPSAPVPSSSGEEAAGESSEGAVEEVVPEEAEATPETGGAGGTAGTAEGESETGGAGSAASGGIGPG